MHNQGTIHREFNSFLGDLEECSLLLGELENIEKNHKLLITEIDEEIFDSIINSLIKLNKESGKDMQLIVVNNGYPEFLPKECLKVEFAANGQKGLIDDAI